MPAMNSHGQLTTIMAMAQDIPKVVLIPTPTRQPKVVMAQSH